MSALKAEYEFYLRQKAAILAEHEGKVVVIKDQTVIGAYDSDEEALRETTKSHEIGTFLLHRCIKDEEVQYFHSRVRFGTTPTPA